MLPLQNLDDRSFEEILANARKMIPSLFPEWTDENYHDPGITLLELFAWLIEAQQYYLNQVPEKNELKFLKLLGVEPRGPTSARADVTFEGVSEAIALPRGTPLEANDQIFETEESILLLPAKIEKILIRTEMGTSDLSSSNESQGASYFAFGNELKEGNQLLIGLNEALPVSESIAMTIKLFEDYAVPLNPLGSGRHFVPSGKVVWEYFGFHDGEQGEWLPLSILRDETRHFSFSGRLHFTLPTEMKPLLLHPATDRERFWIRCMVADDNYELPPKVEQIDFNTISAKQRQTLSYALTFSSTGKPGQVVQFRDAAPMEREIEVQAKTADGEWVDWLHPYEVERDAKTFTVTITFGGKRDDAIPPAGENNLRVVCFYKSFVLQRTVGKSLGLPNQVWNTGLENILPDRFLLQVGKKDPVSGQYRWNDWTRVADFDNSRPDDAHYILDEARGTIRFGDNEKGIIPPAADIDNIRIVACQIGGGERGNVNRNVIHQIVSNDARLQALRVYNRDPAKGGARRETIDDAKRRLRKEFNEPHRAVTDADYERLALKTPGLRVARVKAIPLFHDKLVDYPKLTAPGQISLVVVPFSEDARPLPSDGFLKTVKHYIDARRLIATEVHVIAPVYIKIAIHAVVVAENSLKNNPRRIVDELRAYLSPIGSGEHRGWPFGKPVFKSDIYEIINRVKEVHFVQDLWIEAEGPGKRQGADGDIYIPPHGLVFSTTHHIEILSPDEI